MKDLITLTEFLGDALPKALPNLTLTKNVIKSSDRRFFYFATKAHVPTKSIYEIISKELLPHGIESTVGSDGDGNLQLFEGDKTLGGVVITNTSLDRADSALNQGILMSVNDYSKL